MNNKPKREKFRNELREAFTRNFSNCTIDRYIMIDNELMNETEQSQFVYNINEKLWKAIQEVNMLVNDRIVPFVCVKRVLPVDNRLRIIVNDYDSSRKLSNYEETESLDLNDVSHLINFKPLSPQRRIMISDTLIPGDAKMLIDENELVEAAVDIFLDIAMFNSYTFLKDSSIDEKKLFNKVKFDYYLKSSLTSYYDIDKKNPPAYFSFAFYAREGSKCIDYDKYVWIWDEFIATYPNIDLCVNQQPAEFIKKFYRDVEKLDDRYLSNDFWDLQSKGAKLLLRINREPNTNERKKMIGNYFGIEPFRIGAVKIVPINEYYKPFINKQLKELYISAFKIIV